MQDPNLKTLRHSAAHVLASAVKKCYPQTKLGIGPAIEDGFYYDFDFGNQKISEDDLPKIEAEMKKIIKRKLPFVRQEISVEEAKEIFKDQPYKLELIKSLALEPSSEPSSERGSGVSVYELGDFVDLCKGPHVKDTSEIKAFKLTHLAGAYWKGSEKNPMLTRIYGTAFPTQKELDNHLKLQEEAKKRDHRKIGKELEIYAFADEVGPGLPLWLPNGTIIKDQLETWAKETEKEWGYDRVRTPHIGKKILYETSGHLPYYDEGMFPPLTDPEGGTYYLKPMNCPHHHMIYKSKMRSYRELPLRLAEYGEVYRYEQSGELHGLMRVRFITQNDAHIYCSLDQAKDEFKKVIQLHQYYYTTLGIKDYYMELALRDPNAKDKYHGDERMWQKSEDLTKKAMEESGVPYIEKEGEAAFYGPKVDFNIKAVTGKEFGASTNQLDLYMADRFGLKYIGADGGEHTPAIIHRAPLGSSERFVGFLIEHFAGAFPVWLAPLQAVIIPIADRHQDYAQKTLNSLKSQNIRVDLDDRDETMQAKIRNAQLQKIPYMLIVGDREEKEGTVSVRLRTGEDLGQMPVEKFKERLQNTVLTKSLNL